MLSRSSSFLALPCLCLALFGLGCNKQNTPTQAPQKVVAKPSANPAVLLFPPASKPNPTVNDELKEVLKNFREANAVHTKFEMSSQQGPLKGDFYVIRPNRFKGTMDTSGGKVEIVIVDNSFFLKADGSQWLDFSNQPSSRAMTDTLKRAMSGNSALDSTGSSDTTLITKTRDESRGCDLYKTTAKAGDGSIVSLEICAENKLPKFVDMTTPQGPVRISYTEYNGLFLIEKPLQ